MRLYSGVLAVWGLCALLAGSSAAAAIEVDFEDLSLAPEAAWYGADGAGGFTSGGAWLHNEYIDFGGGFFVWNGWGYSNITDNTTPGYDNQFSAFAGGGAGGSANYAVAFAGEPRIDLPDGTFPASARITNTTYAAFAMRDGDAFAKKFGGDSGNDPDYFLLTITGLDASGTATGTVEFYLADYRFGDNALDYIVDTWTEVDLTPLGAATALTFALESTDVGPFGMNTPAYFALDDLVLIPEPAAVVALLIGAAVLRRRGC